MNETYGVKGPVHRLEQRKARAFSLSEIPRLGGLRSPYSFDVDFSPSGQVLQITNYSLEGNPIGSEHFVYGENGKTVRSMQRDGAGRETCVSDFVWETKESCVQTIRAASGQFLGRNAEVYERDLLVLFSSYGHRDQLKRQKSFQYANNKLQSSDSRYYVPDGTVHEQWISSYDSQGRIASTYGLDGQGKPLGDGKYTYEYDSEGRKSRVWSFNDWAEDNVANAVTVYEYETDPMGNWVERREFFRFRNDPHWTKHVTTRKLTYYP